MLDQLVSSLLYEGYALYPYTPGATKNATPTPFGVVYPPVYAAECAGAFDHARLECEAEPAAGAALSAELRWLAPDEGRPHPSERRLTLGPIAIGERRTEEFDGGRFTVRSTVMEGGRALVRACVHNTADVAPGLSRAGALADSLISTHIVLRLSAGRFISPLESDARSTNIYPVLATPSDDTVLGATFVLPDHPQIAPQSHGNLFDNTEIEEALTLHVHTLTDEERGAVTDPVVKEMLERALSATPEDIIGMHGGLTGADDNPGEAHVTVDGVRIERGASVILRPGTDGNPHDKMLHGRHATVERIYIDFDDRVHLAVTVDDDPGQALMRETGRYLFFFPHEVELP